MSEMLNLINKYLSLFPREVDRQKKIIKFITENTDIINWNNFNGHIVVGGFIYAKRERKFLVLYHNDLKMFLYPGGHIEEKDLNILEAAKREIFEETGLLNLRQVKILDNELIPIDIDTHIIDYNDRLRLPEYYHFEFRYLFEIDEIKEIGLDCEEHECLKWVDIEELKNNKNYGRIAEKIEKIINEN